MRDRGATAATESIAPATQLGYLELTVADLERSVTYYTGAVGLAVLDRKPTEATLGAGGQALLILREQRGAAPWPRGGRSYTGLYHFALLLPTRQALGAWLRHWLTLGLPLPGQADHLVSEACYLEDPDGHGIEVYRDRPRSEWRWDRGQVRMASDPIDIRGLLNEAPDGASTWSGVPAATTLGHIHLQVGDLERTSRFYREILGFDVMATMPSARFLAAGGYHHHIGMNVWHSQGASSAPGDVARLLAYTVDLPSAAALEQLRSRLERGTASTTSPEGTLSTTDPAGNRIRFRVRPVAAPVTPARSSFADG